VEQLQNLTRDVPERDKVVTVPRDGLLKIDLPMRTNDVVLVRLDRIAG
jgi:xylan 1,4-beta-xylosidase